MKDNKELKQVYDKLDSLSNDEHMRRIAEWREKAIISERTNLNASYNEGHTVGIAEGTQKTKEKIATQLLKENMSIEFVQKITGLSTNKIEELKLNLK